MKLRIAYWTVRSALPMLLALVLMAGSEIPPPRDILRHAADRGAAAYIVKAFRGDFDGDGLDDAIAFIHYAYIGEPPDREISIFRNTGGRFEHVKVVEGIVGQNPARVRFRRGAVSFSMTVHLPGDPPCCPRGSKFYRIKL